MADIEKAIRILEGSYKNFVLRHNGELITVNELLALLKAQEPRVMTWKEAQASVNSGPFIIMEVRDSTGTEVDYGVLVEDSYEMSEGSLLTVCNFWMLEEEYGKCFRCWTSRPTDEQREVVKWNG